MVIRSNAETLPRTSRAEKSDPHLGTGHATAEGPVPLSDANWMQSCRKQGLQTAWKSAALEQETTSPTLKSSMQSGHATAPPRASSGAGKTPSTASSKATFARSAERRWREYDRSECTKTSSSPDLLRAASGSNSAGAQTSRRSAAPKSSKHPRTSAQSVPGADFSRRTRHLSSCVDGASKSASSTARRCRALSSKLWSTSLRQAAPLAPRRIAGAASLAPLRRFFAGLGAASAAGAARFGEGAASDGPDEPSKFRRRRLVASLEISDAASTSVAPLRSAADARRDDPTNTISSSEPSLRTSIISPREAMRPRACTPARRSRSIHGI
mmetsp:Transcript_20000/g.71122  ORF Transcript_20000/g.71122 Transcript_20000/m.71122 type:complete len:327 (+) Transcript_20000:593-1573(+)